MEEKLSPPSSYYPNLNLVMQQESRSTRWTREENKRFERALAIFDEKTPDRWLKVAAVIPGKSVPDVVRQYMKLEADVSDIEAGLVPIPGYLTSSSPSSSSSSFTLEMVDDHEFRKRPFTGRSSDQERKKGVPWTEDEHRRFLMGLQKYGKGDWRNISRNFVISKTPTQVASHAQKYFIRQSSGGKDKRRPSIHDITTVHLTDAATAAAATPPQGNNGEFFPSLDNSTLLRATQKSSAAAPKILLNWNQIQSGDGAAVMVLGSSRANAFLQRPYEIASLLQIQSARYQVHG